MAFKIYLKTNLKNKKQNLKVWIESKKKCPKTCTPMHWENMKVMIRDPFKMEEVAQLRVARRCQQSEYVKEVKMLNKREGKGC